MSDKNERSLEQTWSGRQIWLDVARTIAILCVTINHALGYSFSLENETFAEFCRMPAYASFLKAALFILSRLGVPLFLMISGTLLLGKDYESRNVTKRFIRHNWWTLLRTTWIWLAIMFWLLQASENSVLRTEGIFAAIWRFLQTMLFIHPTTMPNMWYMPMILCVYLLIPVIGIAIQKIDNRIIAGIVLLGIFSSMVIPTLSVLLFGITGQQITITTELKPQYLLSYYLFYVIIGYWIHQGKLKKIPGWVICCCVLVGFLLTAAFQFWCYSRENVEHGILYNDVGVLFTSAMAFELFRRRFGKAKTNLFNKATSYLARISFAIYFVHILVMQVMAKLIGSMGLQAGFRRFVLIELSGVALSVVIIALLTKITVFKKYLFVIK